MAMQQPGGMAPPATAEAPATGMPAAAASGPEMTPGNQPASPEEQDLYDKFVAMAFMALYDKKMMPKTLQYLAKPGGNIADKVGEVAAGIAQRVYASAKDSKIELPGDVVFNAVTEIVEAVIELAEKKGIAEFKDGMMETAYYKALDILGKQAEAQGIYTPDLKAQDAAALQQMSQSGELQQIVGSTAPAGAPPQAGPAQPAPPARMGM
jgi:hypothetical protein